jgi:hypothetical protein
MRRRRSVSQALHIVCACAALATLVAVAPAPATEPVTLACSAERPAVPLGTSVRVRAWTNAGHGAPVRYTWEVTAGRVDGGGSEVRWDLDGVRPGRYAAIARVLDPSGVRGECSLRVLVTADAGTRGQSAPRSPAAARPARETGSALLVAGQQEAGGYGLYSYLLLGAPPAAGARDRYLKAMEAYVRLIPDLAALERYVPKGELNAAYVPITEAPPGAATPEWILDHYDYARARSVLRMLPGRTRDGPYIVSSLTALAGGDATASAPVLLQDLSAVPPHLAEAWVREFLNQTAQERFTEARTRDQMVVRLRLVVGILGAGLPEVRSALDNWIAWVR